MPVELNVNGQTRTVAVEPRTSLLDCLREELLLTGAHAGCEHGVCGACTVLVDGAPVRSCLMFAVQADGYAITTIEGLSPGPGELSPIQDAFCETHGMQCGYCTPAMILAAHALLAKNPAPTREEIVDAISGNICRCTGYAQIVEAIALAAERMRGLNRPAEHPMSAHAVPVRLDRPPRARGSPLRRRQGPLRRRHRCRGRKHVALVTCPHPAARIVSIDKAAALAMPGVHYVLDGAELAAATHAAAGRPRHAERAAPSAGRRRRALCRRMGRGGGGRHPRARRGRRRSGARRIRAAAVRARRRGGLRAGSPLVHAAHGSNVLLDRTFVWGEVEQGFRREPAHAVKHRVNWGRSSTVPIETFGVTASWDPWREMLDVWASIQMPRYPDQIALRAEAAGLVGARAQRRRRRRQLRRQARHQAHRAGRLSVAPARRRRCG